MPRRCLQTIVAISLVASHILLYALALSIPVVLALQTVFSHGDFSWQAWIEAAADLSRWRVLLVNSLIVGASAVGVAVLLGTTLAWLSFKTRWPGRSLMVLILILAAAMPSYVIASAVLSCVDFPLGGGSAVTAGLVQGLSYIPLASVLIGLGLLYVEPELEAAALLDRAPWEVLVRISLARSAWSIAAASGVIFWLVTTDYMITVTLQVRTFSEEVFTQYQLHGDRAAPFVLALPIMILLGSAFYGLERCAGVLGRPMFQGQSPRCPPLNLRRGACLMATTVLFLVIAALAVVLFSLVRQLNDLADTWKHVQAIAPDWWNTILLAGATCLITAACAVNVAWLWARSRWWRKISGVMLLGLISVPSAALAMTLSWYFNHREPQWLMDAVQPIYDGPCVVVLVWVLRFLPLATLIVLPGIQRVAQTVDDAARADGAGWSQRLIKLYWPQCRAHVLPACLVVLVLALGELECVQLVSPPGTETLSQRLFSFIHVGVDAQVATVCLASVATSVIPAGVLFWIVRRNLL